MKTLKTLAYTVAAVMAGVSSTAWAADDVEKVTITSSVEVAYQCGANKQPMRVTYGLSGNDIVAAQVLFAEKASPVLSYHPEFTDKNVFIAEEEGIVWQAAKATSTSLTKVNGGTLSQRSVVEGKPQAQIVADNCRLDKAATAKLNK